MKRLLYIGASSIRSSRENDHVEAPDRDRALLMQFTSFLAFHHAFQLLQPSQTHLPVHLR